MSDVTRAGPMPDDVPAEGPKPIPRPSSAGSAGGAGGASGVGLQNRVFAWAAAAILAEQTLPKIGLAGVVVRVGAQTHFELDDVAVQTDVGNWALIQVKAGMNLGRTNDSDLADALEQAVTQYLDGPLTVEDGTQREVDPTRDALVLCTNAAAPATVRVDLAEALLRTASQPPGTPLGDRLSSKQSSALTVALDHVRRLWTTAGRAEPGDEELRGFLRALRVITIDANDGEQDYAAAISILSTALPPSADTRVAWQSLVAEGQAASEQQSWRDRAAIGVALSGQGIQLRPASRYFSDIQKLRDLAAANLDRLQGDAKLPVPGGIYIARGVSAQLMADTSDANVLIVGDAGAGKSSVVQELATARSTTQEVLVLRATDVVGARRIALDYPLTSVLRAWTGGLGLVVIDGVDALRGQDDRATLSSTVAELGGSRWQIVATARAFDARNSPQLQQGFLGTPVSSEPAHVDSRLAGVRHLMVGDLTDQELDTVQPPLALATLLAEASQELRALLRNPFNLRLAAQLAPGLTATQHRELLAVRSRVGLLEAYWQWRVHSDDRTARDVILKRLTAAMVSSRELSVVEVEPTVTASDGRAVEALLSQGVLSADNGVFTSAPRVLSFSHNLIFDYAAAIYILLDPQHPLRLLQTLDDDPSLPLIARPSFDLLVDLLWSASDRHFWQVCLDLAASPHVLASLAFAARLLVNIRAPGDLSVLHPSPGRTDVPMGIRPDQELVRQLAGAVRTAPVLPDAARIVPPLSALALRLAENGGTSYTDAALAADLLAALQRRAPVSPGRPGAGDRARAVAALLDVCRTDPTPMEQLAGAAARQLPNVVSIDAAARDAVGRLIDDRDALQQWGGTVLTGLAEAVAPTASHDRDLARRMATAVLTFQETRDEQVNFAGGTLLPLSESRRQQAEFGAYLLGESFSELCAADVLLAAEIYCDLTEDGTRPQHSCDWPVTVADAVGYLQFGRDVSLTRDGVGEAAAAALSTALVNAGPDSSLPILTLLADRLRNTAAWAALMSSTKDMAALGRALLPALESGALLGNPDTHPPAAGLLRALARDDPTVADRLEAIVLRAHALIDATGGGQRTKDVLLGCLVPNTITSPVLNSRLQEIGVDELPNIEPRVYATRGSEPWSPLDDLVRQGVPLDGNIDVAARALDDVLRVVNGGGADDRPEAERRLFEVFIQADEAFVEVANLPPHLEHLRIDGAAALARDPRILPGTDVGDRVLEILLSAASSPNAGEFLK